MPTSDTVAATGGASAWRIVEDDLTSAAILELLDLHAAEMQANSPRGACHFLPVDALRDDAVTVWSMWDGDLLAGCGALQELDERSGEIKSMRTAPDQLGRGVGRAMLDHIVDVARQRGYGRLSLETGRGDSFAAAVHLYERFGFTECGPFGGYVDNGFSRFFTRPV
jgi:putative acetyltransferase